MKIKRLLQPGIAALLLSAVPHTGAFTYTDGDVLLVFRSTGLHNVVFDLGNVSQFLGHPNGYTNLVANWNPAVVTSNYPFAGGGTQFAVLATTSSSDPNPTAWVSDAQPLVSVADVVPSVWQNGLYSPISATGTGAAGDAGAPAGTNYDVISPTTHGAFDYITSDNGTIPAAIPYLGGTAVNFKTVGSTPTTVLFYAVQPSLLTPKPAGSLIGSFTLGGDGSLVFQAGPLLDSTTITSVSAGGGSVPVTFNTRAAVKYQLFYSTSPQSSLSSWAALPATIAGTGSPLTLIDTSATNSARFYNVESYP